MKFTHLLTAMCCAMSLDSLGEEKQTEMLDYSNNVEMTNIIKEKKK